MNAKTEWILCPVGFKKLSSLLSEMQAENADRCGEQEDLIDEHNICR